MATISIIFHHREGQSSGAIRYRICHQRRSRCMTTPYRLLPSEWDSAEGNVTTLPEPRRREAVLDIRRQIALDLNRLNRIIDYLDTRVMHFTATDIITEYRRYQTRFSLFNFIGDTILTLRGKGQLRTAETYTAALRSFSAFRKGCDIMLDALTFNIIDQYQSWMIDRGLTRNTMSFYNRILHALYNRALDDPDGPGLPDLRPFRHAYTGVEKTVKRAIPIETVRDIAGLDLSSSPALSFARDIFILSFMLRGMSFIDMAFLRKSDLADGHLTYHRRKTGQIIRIGWTPAMQAILDRLGRSPRSPFLLPIIAPEAPDIRAAYLAQSCRINRHLKQVGSLAGLATPLTLYVARHSWASAARNKGIPLNIISEGMGHNSEATTRIYLASIDTTAVDAANDLLISSIL